MRAPTVTIGISFFNNAESLIETAQCVFAQTLQDWELILIDDGSTDGGADVARRIDDPRVTVISDGVNKGRPARYNQITELARGRYIVRFDADDLIHPTKLAKQVALLEANPDLDLVGTGMLSLAPTDAPRGRRHDLDETAHDKICATWPLGHVALSHGGVMGRTEWFKRHPYDPAYRKMAEDLALWAHSMHDSRFSNVPEPLYYYRDFETQSFRKYYQTKAAAIRLNRTVDKAHYSAAVRWRAILANIARIAIYAVATFLHLEPRLVARRSNEIAPEDREQFELAMAVIRATDVPGVS